MTFHNLYATQQEERIRMDDPNESRPDVRKLVTVKHPNGTILVGDCRDGMRSLPEKSVHCVVTSPPYWGLRDYGHDGQIGLEKTPEEYVAGMVDVFREIRRVLRDDGTVWLNLGDSYAANRGGTAPPSETLAGGVNGHGSDESMRGRKSGHNPSRDPACHGLKHKDLVGIPWRLAFALQADGWYLRQDIIWHKPSPMPESVQDRCTKAHEYIFLLTKKARYFYDRVAVEEEADRGDCGSRYDSGKTAGHHDKQGHKPRFGGSKYGDSDDRHHQTKSGNEYESNGTRNKRSVWTVSSQGYPGAHFATFPPKLIEPCILAGSSEGGCCEECGSPYIRIVESKKLTRDRPNDYVKRTGEDGTGNSCSNSVAGVESRTLGWEKTCKCETEKTKPCVVLDPFGGSGTTAKVAIDLGRRFVLCELNPEYVELIKSRIEQPGLF